MISIYVLINPLNDHVFYVGASMNPKSRLSSHCSSIYDNFKGNIIASILESGLKPELVVVDKVEYDKASFFEDFYLDLFKSWGFNLPQVKSAYSGGLLSTFQQKTLHIYAK